MTPRHRMQAKSAQGAKQIHKKQTVEGARQLHIAALRQEGVLTAPCGSVWIVPRPGSGETIPSIGVVRTVTQAGQPAIRLDYSLIDQHSGQRTYVEELVELTIISCHFGGVRPWFRWSYARMLWMGK